MHASPTTAPTTPEPADRLCLGPREARQLLAGSPWRRFVPVPMRAGLRERLSTLNRVVRGLTEQVGGVHVDFVDHVALDESLLSAGMVHANRRGHAVIAADVARALAAHVAARPRTVA